MLSEPKQLTIANLLHPWSSLSAPVYERKRNLVRSVIKLTKNVLSPVDSVPALLNAIKNQKSVPDIVITTHTEFEIIDYITSHDRAFSSKSLKSPWYHLSSRRIPPEFCFPLDLAKVRSEIFKIKDLWLQTKPVFVRQPSLIGHSLDKEGSIQRERFVLKRDGVFVEGPYLGPRLWKKRSNGVFAISNNNEQIGTLDISMKILLSYLPDNYIAVNNRTIAQIGPTCSIKMRKNRLLPPFLVRSDLHIPLHDRDSTVLIEPIKSACLRLVEDTIKEEVRLANLE